VTHGVAWRSQKGDRYRKGNGMGPVMKGWDARLQGRDFLLASLDPADRVGGEVEARRA